MDLGLEVSPPVGSSHNKGNAADVSHLQTVLGVGAPGRIQIQSQDFALRGRVHGHYQRARASIGSYFENPAGP